MSSEIVPKTPYVIVRNGTCYFDMRVPVDVVGAYRAKLGLKSGAIRFSLHTKDRKKAQRLAAKHLGHFEGLFSELRRTGDAEQDLANKIGRGDLSKLSRAEMEKLVTDYYRDVLRPFATSPAIDSEDEDELVAECTDTIKRMNGRLAGDTKDQLRNTADHILRMAGWPSTQSYIGAIPLHFRGVNIDRETKQYVDLMDLVRRASLEGSRLALAELKGASYTPSDPLFATGFNLAEANDKLGPLLSEALAAWKEGSGVLGSRKPRDLTATEAASAVRRFTELHGDIRIGEITKKRVQEFASAIVALPAHLPTKLAKLTLPELLREDLSKFRQRAPGTINKAFQLLAAIVEDARNRSDLEEATLWPNHFPSARVDEDDEDRERDPFNADDLKRIFIEGPVHGQGERQRGGQGEAQYWLPLLALFTGARLSELGQLRVCDVQADDGGIAFLDIGTSGGRKVKTRASIRPIPLHPTLIRLGFPAYVEQRREAGGGEATLWPLLRSAEGRAHTAAWSQWFGNYLRREPISISDKAKVFHSFRHTFKRACRDAGVSEEVHDALTGHAAGKSVGRGYGAGISVGRLAEEISKVKVPVDLSHVPRLRVRKSTADRV